MRMSKRVSWLVESSSIALLLVLCCYVCKVANGMEREVKGNDYRVWEKELHERGGVNYWVWYKDIVRDERRPHKKVVRYGALKGTLEMTVEDDKNSVTSKEGKRVYGCGWVDEHVLAIVMEGGGDGEACELLLGRMELDSGMPTNVQSSVFKIKMNVMGKMGVQAAELEESEWDEVRRRKKEETHSCTISYTMLSRQDWNTFWAEAMVGRSAAILYVMLPGEQWQAMPKDSAHKLPVPAVGKLMKIIVDSEIHVVKK